MYDHICGGRGWDKGNSTYLQNVICRVESNVKIVKADFHSFCSILDQNALLKAAQTNRKCSRILEWKGMGFSLKRDNVSKIHLEDDQPDCKVARTTMLYMNALWSEEKGKLSSYCISFLVL